LIVGHSHSFDRPILRTREIVQSGAVGAVKMISAHNYTDYLYRPRRPEDGHRRRRGRACSVRGRTRSTSSGCWARYRSACADRCVGRRPPDRRRLRGVAQFCRRRIRVSHVQRLRAFRQR
jgi:hypothetical protein